MNIIKFIPLIISVVFLTGCNGGNTYSSTAPKQELVSQESFVYEITYWDSFLGSMMEMCRDDEYMEVCLEVPISDTGLSGGISNGREVIVTETVYKNSKRQWTEFSYEYND